MMLCMLLHEFILTCYILHANGYVHCVTLKNTYINSMTMNSGCEHNDTSAYKTLWYRTIAIYTYKIHINQLILIIN